MQKLLQSEDKIDSQDDIVCLLGTAMHEFVSQTTVNMVATVLTCRNYDVIKQPKLLQYELAMLGINIYNERHGFWTPYPGDNNEIAFLARKRKVRPRFKSRLMAQTLNFQTV